MKFVIYEIWTRSRVVEAEDMVTALSDHDPARPDDISGLSLSNWHAVAVEEEEK